MEKLPNAPLLEIIFELRWKVDSKAELSKCQYLHGDLYALLKEDYPYRESLISPEVPIELYISVPAHRFRTSQEKYPLVQVGPGLITVNTTGDEYYWNDFEKKINSVLNRFSQVYKFESEQKVSLALQYFDFLLFDFSKDNVHEYLTNNLNVNINQNFHKSETSPTGFNFGFQYQTKIGVLSVLMNRGKNLKKEDGIIIQTSILNSELHGETKIINSWLEEAHSFCSNLFKNMMKPSMYESFKKQ
jgi:uncharacterized protein (TIGR04255 family)